MRGYAEAPAPGINRHTIIAALCAACIAIIMAFAAGSARGAVWIHEGGFAASNGGFVPAPTGVTVDQPSDKVYVANFLRYNESFETSAGPVLKFDLAGTPGTPASFGVGSDGVAVDPSTGNIYGLSDYTLLEPLSPGQIQAYTPAGAPVGSPIPVTTLSSADGGRMVQIAADSTGNVYFPSIAADVVQGFKPDGTPLPSINGSGANALSNPNSVAIDNAGNFYVVDDVGGGRVQKFDSAGNFLTVIGGSGATGIGVNPVSGAVFVVQGQGATTHVIAYSPAGVELDDFGLGDFAEAISYGYSQVGVDVASGRVYVTDPGEGAVEMYDPLPAPTVVTKAATAITKTGAKLNATVDAEGTEADCEFAYDDNPGFSSPATAPCVPNPVIGSTETPVGATIAGLSANTTYYFHVIAENEGGTSAGADLQFTTLPNAPTAKTDAASSLAQTTATLNATVNASGANTTCKFEWGTSASYGKSVPCSLEPVTGTFDTAVTGVLSGLSAGTTYHYRVSTSNPGGSANGTDQSFTTLADTCATNSALCPPPPGTTPPATTPPVTTPPPATKPLKCKKGFKKKKVKGKTKCVKAKKHKKSKKH